MIYNAEYYSSSDVTHQGRLSVTHASSQQIIWSLNLRNVFIIFEVIDEPTGKGFSQKTQPLLHAEVLNTFYGRGRTCENEPNMKGAYRRLRTNILRKNPKAYCLEMS